ncbi:hypothetical protein AVEN_237004-1 [Araneus ventricosus]|uniref:Uncharacterized protein n=1 Tax=Araneus ventricosus TaxID=182803 RepID=A0A4Y2P8I2_ARAVE|nr:hypothetical protein AVEN_100683-1 [Araneus ventricosus]GBN47377.1 hypothetical protein AVEN_237004-1 [Araneus ventricosus]
MPLCTFAFQKTKISSIVQRKPCSCEDVFFFSNPSDLNQIRSMRSFAFITSNRKSGGLSRSSYTKATQSSRYCGVASVMLHFVQILNFLSPQENLRVFKWPEA